MIFVPGGGVKVADNLNLSRYFALAVAVVEEKLVRLKALA